MAHIEAKRVGQMLEQSIARAFSLHAYTLLLGRGGEIIGWGYRGFAPARRYGMFRV